MVKQRAESIVHSVDREQMSRLCSLSRGAAATSFVVVFVLIPRSL